MQKLDRLKMAYRISKSNKKSNVPVNDIVKYIKDLESSGVRIGNLESMVSTMVKNKSSEDEVAYRRPDAREILIYDLPEEKQDLVLNPC
jgi:hypothetical protein